MMSTLAVIRRCEVFSTLYLICVLVEVVKGDTSRPDAISEAASTGRLLSADGCAYLTDGIPGPPGLPGEFGDYGPSGPKGLDGLQGRDGYPGENVTASGATGERGDQGKPGLKGGPGSIGGAGLQGYRGRVGLKGSRGPLGEDDVGTGSMTGEDTMGDPGSTGYKGERGEPGNDGKCACSEETDNDAVDPNFSAFSVARHSSLQSTDGEEVITWDHVFTNAIGDFIPDTGIFTCCIPGYYYFSFHAQKTASSENTMVQLMHNGNHVSSALEYGELDDEDSTTNSVVLHLDYDDRVWLELYDTTGFYGSHQGYTTFHGYLQYAD